MSIEVCVCENIVVFLYEYSSVQYMWYYDAVWDQVWIISQGASHNKQYVDSMFLQRISPLGEYGHQWP